MLLKITRRNAPTAIPRGPRKRAPRRKKIGEPLMSRMVMLLNDTSSSNAPSTLSKAIPLHPSKTQLLTVMFLNPPLDSVPNLTRPVRGTRTSEPYFLSVPSRSVPTS